MLACCALLLLIGQEIIARQFGLVAPSSYLSPTFLAPAAIAAFALFCLLHPREEWRRVLLAGLALEAARIVLHLASGRDPLNLVLFPGFGLGVASWGYLAWRALRERGERRQRRLDILAGAVAIPLGHLLLWPSILGTIPFLPTLHDAMLLRLDASLGFHPSAAIGLAFAALPPLKLLHVVIYFQIPLAMYLVAGLEERDGRRLGLGVIPACLVSAVIGYFIYMMMPAVGPRPIFGEAFAQAMWPAATLVAEPLVNTTHPRNAMPSLHMTWALLVYLSARRHGRVAHLCGALFALGTALATLGLGEHYFIDLVVAVPLVLLTRALCATGLPLAQPERVGAIVQAVLVIAGWSLIARGAIDPTAWPGLTPALMAATIAAGFAAERALLLAGRRAPAPAGWQLPATAD